MGVAGAVLETSARDATGAAASAASRAAAEAAAAAAAKTAAEDAAKAAAKTAAEDAAKLAAKDAAKLAAAGAAAAGLGYMALSSNQTADKSNKTPRGITKIESSDGRSKKVLKVSFSPAIRILQSDVISISGSKTTPSIDGPQTVKSVVNDQTIIIDFGKDITTMTEGGSIGVQTTPAAQAQADVGTAAAGVGSTLGSAAGGATGGLLGGLGGDFLSGLGVDPEVFKWSCIAIIILIVIVILYKVLS
jgi:hypothetical protein